MKLEEAILIGKGKAAKAKTAQMDKQVGRPLTKMGIIKIFNHSCNKYGYTKPLITKELERMVSGFIKVFHNGGITSEQVYKFISGYVREFGRFKGTKVITGKGKEFSLGNEPHLKDLIFGRDFLWAEMQKSVGKSVEGSKQEIQPLSEEDFEAEFNRAMREL